MRTANYVLMHKLLCLAPSVHVKRVCCLQWSGRPPQIRHLKGMTTLQEGFGQSSQYRTSTKEFEYFIGFGERGNVTSVTIGCVVLLVMYFKCLILQQSSTYLQNSNWILKLDPDWDHWNATWNTMKRDQSWMIWCFLFFFVLFFVLQFSLCLYCSVCVFLWVYTFVFLMLNCMCLLCSSIASSIGTDIGNELWHQSTLHIYINKWTVWRYKICYFSFGINIIDWNLSRWAHPNTDKTTTINTEITMNEQIWAIREESHTLTPVGWISSDTDSPEPNKVAEVHNKNICYLPNYLKPTE